jgi:hypothetical protein
MRKAVIFAVAAVLFLVSCAAVPPIPSVPISGNTTASPMLRNDMLKMLSVMFDCSKIDAVETEILSSAPDSDGADYAVIEMLGGKPESSIRERWTAIGCGRRMPLEVTFVSDGKGGTYIVQESPK